MTTLAVPVESEGDDFFWNKDGGFFNLGTTLRFGNISDVWTNAGIRVVLPITKDATIASVVLTSVAPSARTLTTCNALLSFAAADNLAAPTSYAEAEAAYGTKTTTVAWDSVEAWPTAGATYQSPNFRAALQEIVNRAGWSSGNNALLFIADNASSKNAVRYIAAYDNITYDPPLFTVEYTEGGGSTQIANPLFFGAGF